MKKTYIITTMMFCACLTVAAFAQSQSSSPCVGVPVWKDLSAPERREALGKTFDRFDISDACFARAVSSLHSSDKKLLADSLATVFSSRSAKGKFSLELLFSLFRANKIVSDKPLWEKIVDIWVTASTDAPYVILASNSEGGKIPIADTLYRVLDAAGMVDAHELLRFGRVKCLLGDYLSAAALYCRVISEDKRVEHAALTQLGQFFSDADSSVKLAALGSFEKCVLALPDIDTAFYRSWLADYYGRQGLHELEIAVLTAFTSDSSLSGRKLEGAAKRHFSRQRYRHAATAAVTAHGRLEGSNRQNNAFLAHQAYMRLGMRDSALAWLRTSGVSNAEARIRAVALSQETGRLVDAEALLDSVPPSLSKDTLIVRQHIFSGELGKAQSHVSAAAHTWRAHPTERMFWQARVLIYSGRPFDAAPLLDSIKLTPTWHGASEVLRSKYWIQKLEDEQSALDAWGRLEFFVYIGDLQAAAQFLKKAKLIGEPGEMLAVRLARKLSAAALPQEALEILDLVESPVADQSGGLPDFGIKGIPGRDDKASKNVKKGKDGKDAKDARTPEYLYFKAEILKELGRKDETRAIAQRILKEHPGDVFAQKARILLTKI